MKAASTSSAWAAAVNNASARSGAVSTICSARARAYFGERAAKRSSSFAKRFNLAMLAGTFGSCKDNLALVNVLPSEGDAKNIAFGPFIGGWLIFREVFEFVCRTSRRDQLCSWSLLVTFVFRMSGSLFYY